MAVATAGTSNTTYATRTNTTVTLPASLGAGDYTLTWLYVDDSSPTVTIPSGYTAPTPGVIFHTPGNVLRVWVAYRAWQSGDGNPQWTHASAATQGFAIRVTGADTSTFLDPTTPTTAEGDSTATHGVSGGITTTQANTGLFLINGNYSGGAYSAWSSPLTEVLDPSGQSAAGFGVQAAAGASGSKTATGPTTDYVSFLMGIREASAAATVTPPRPVIVRQAVQRASVR